MIKVGIIGAAGYTAGELIRLLVHHPQAQIVFAQSSSQAGQPVAAVHEGLTGDTDLCFVAEADLEAVDVLFLCAGHGKSSAFWAAHTRPEHLRVIDLAQDYRDEHDGYIYGLPEWQRDRQSRLLCYSYPVGTPSPRGFRQPARRSACNGYHRLDRRRTTAVRYYPFFVA